MRYARIAIVATVLLVVSNGSGGSADGPRSPAATRAEVERAVNAFLVAFEHLDWQRFTAAFEDAATVFFPAPELPGRFSGRAEFEPQFQKVFAAIRASNPAGPPYHELKTEELTVQVLAEDVALASFLLRNEQRTARRTLVLVKIDGKWLIQHLHASNVPKQ